MSKSVCNPSVQGMKGCENDKKILTTAHILWGQILLQILVGGHLLVIEKNCRCQNRPGTLAYRLIIKVSVYSLSNFTVTYPWKYSKLFQSQSYRQLKKIIFITYLRFYKQLAITFCVLNNFEFFYGQVPVKLLEDQNDS